MIKRNGRVATLLVAATAISSLVPVAANATVMNNNKTCIEYKNENLNKDNINCDEIDKDFSVDVEDNADLEDPTVQAPTEGEDIDKDFSVDAEDNADLEDPTVQAPTEGEDIDKDFSVDEEDNSVVEDGTAEDDMIVDGDTESPSLNKVEISVQGQWIRNEDGKWSFIKADGTIKTGWLSENGTSYYFNAKGEMQIGWVKDNGNWYYLNINGSLATNTTIDGLKVGSDGALI